MNFLKYYLAIILVITLNSLLFSQEQMTVKPKDYNPERFINQNNSISLTNTLGYTISGLNMVTQYPNVRVFNSPYNQTEPSISVSPSSPNNIFIGANTDYGMGYYSSFNSGTSYSGGDIMPGSVYYSTNPYVAHNNTGALYYNYLDDYIVTDRSFNNGLNWGGRMVVPSSTLYDMNTIAIDKTPTSSFYNRIYVAWSNFNLTQPAIYLSYSTDNGITFSNSIPIGSPQASHYEQGAKLIVTPSGVVYCFWATPNISNNNIEDKIAFTKSTDGGITWSAPAYPITINGIRGFLQPNGIRVNSFPSAATDNNGNIFLTWSQRNLAPAGSDADVCFSFSNNGGTSFSNPVRVNDDALNNGKNQFLPWIAVDNINDNVAIAFYDNRDAYSSDSCDIYASVSTNGGTSFTNIKVSDRTHRPVPLSGYADGYYSDYIGVAASNNFIYPAWADNRNGIVQIYTANVELKPYITHTPLKDTENLTGPYAVSANIYAFGASLPAGEQKIFYGIGSITDSISMANTSGNTYTASIPGNGTASTYKYYIKASDLNGKVSLLPINAPSNTFTFATGSDVTKPVINHTPITYSSWIHWPDTINAYVSDNRGIDSVWVKWYRNNPSTGIKEFKLNNVSGDIYKGVFNSSRVQISPNDSIYYRVFAQDNSTNHNADSTLLYHYTVNSQALVFAGNGTVTASHPFKTFYMDAKTDMLYLASELTPVWGNDVARINAIGFNVLNASPQMMNGLTMKIQNTALTSLTGFTNSGWTTVYSTNYTITNTGWVFFNFSPFIWDGTSNILIEVCYNDASINSNSAVTATSKPGLTWHQYQDLPNGSGCTDLNGGALQTNRPNLAFVLNSIIDIKQIGTEIPTTFTLKQNYPNPFNPVTKISFDIPKKAFVSLKVYDMLGKEVARLVSEDKSAGKYIFDFNASYLSSGVYFYKLEAGDFTETRRMVVLK
jgi:hypothetical protein